MKKVLVVSDLHVGSIYAIMPDEVYLEKGDAMRSNPVGANPLQQTLYSIWCGMIDTTGTVDAVYVLGDTADGSNQRERAYELWTPNIHQQARTAADLIAMIKVRKKNYFFVDGSGYHVSGNPSYDLLTCMEIFNVKQEDAKEKLLNKKFGSDLAVTVEGEEKRLHLCHWASWSSSEVSKATGAQGEMTAAQKYKDQYGVFDALLHGHTHEFRIVRDAYQYFVNCPGWECRNSYKQKKGLRGGPPNIGYIILEMEKGREIRVEPHVYIPTREQLFNEVSM